MPRSPQGVRAPQPIVGKSIRSSVSTADHLGESSAPADPRWVSDREAEQRVKFDLQWRYALDIDIDAGVFDASTPSRFRARLLANGQELAAFEQFVTAARDAGS